MQVNKGLRKHTKALLDAHLMVSHPIQWVDDMAAASVAGALPLQGFFFGGGGGGGARTTNLTPMFFGGGRGGGNIE